MLRTSGRGALGLIDLSWVLGDMSAGTDAKSLLTIDVRLE